ncbi:orotidine-5'-phosphate decarboxylase [Microbacterium sp. zg.Y1090]|uniref:orotidine-5'-phosphate decarboxylase n=1 Tax=Microbacterium TaxID=33882 RepID=UPI00214BD009|nr:MULTISPECIES: orotidine-5'-phosphate decarboxylase [unclassified Microbacterium]MCR2811905.1 orotidine-5'-phosphate decarboxylase [Microbacterium sp. zg.Y1084]MCR2818656.1 orotidine-5'-phosphate decarboxylase [Microbacterium sp. zg.Y1090]MDL5486469.1 orotidine-5'-phosphate decarboxylase [Microbacterium sp. zg-Y1211]WIM29653.1 orotidine-5'-phosphate decarboxylase [Microbacterium sp. zg-Y1090]
MTTFGSRLRDALSARGPLCVGIDPHPHLLADWALPASAAGVREFGLRVVDAAAGRVGIVKPQVSFFEQWGSAGFAALEDVLAAARAAGLLVIADAKRGDIGTTMAAYAEAWLTPGSPLEADALTVSPYLGVGALDGTLRHALAHGKGAFVLAATSNPEARGLQQADLAGATVSARVLAEVAAFNAQATVAGEPASIGVVIGATVDLTASGLTAPSPAVPVLAPGFGAQGAQPEDLAALLGPLTSPVIASESRSILSAGPASLAARISERAALYPEVDHR